MNEYRSFRYINAFFNFYFFIEDLYGGGKTKNYHVEENFKRSIHIIEAIKDTIKEFNEQLNLKRHQTILIDFLELEKLTYTVEGIISLIVKTRGNLHHFSQKSTQKKGHPLNQRDFETMAYLLMSICIRALVKLLAGEMPR